MLFCLSFPAQATDIISLTSKSGQETITLSVPDGAIYKVFTMGSPDRLVVDVSNSAAPSDIKLPESYSGKLIRAVRGGQFNPQTTRVVFDLNQSVNVLSAKLQDARMATYLVVTITAGSGSKNVLVAPAASEKSAARNADDGDEAPAPKEKGKRGKDGKEKDKKEKKPKKQQKPLIVIDPGHGGVDPGTHGSTGVYEKHLVLDYAKALKARLLKTGKYRVQLTRNDDTFIMLRERVVIARSSGASIFVSLHADSAPDAARGLSVYTLSEKSSDQQSEALAARENKADVLAGLDLSTESKDVADILISLAQRETKNQSATLADLIVLALDGKVKMLENSHRFAGFAVLKAPDVPSILVEIGFLSNPAEEKLLLSKAHRERIVNGLASGIDSYFQKNKDNE